MHVTAFARCPFCKGLKRPQFYRGKRVARCSCDDDYRSPVETRRDAVLDEHGDDPDAYTSAVLAKLAQDGLFDIAASFCPAGKLTMAETKAREASGMEAGTVETVGLDAKHASAVAATSGETPKSRSSLQRKAGAR